MSTKMAKRIGIMAEMAQATLDKFTVEFARDPAHALNWSNGTFAAAAELKVAKMLLAAIEDGATLANIRETLTSRVLYRAKFPPQSTSPTANLIEQYELAASAEILSGLEYYTE